MKKNILNKVLSITNPYIMRYCDTEYIPSVKNYLSIMILGLPNKINASEEAFFNSPHQIVYDYKHLIKDTLKKVLDGKDDSFVEDFYHNILKIIRGGYIDGVEKGNLDREKKISIGKLFTTLIENISLIEGKDIDEFIKLKTHLVEVTKQLEAVPSESEYYYWKYPSEYLRLFEELLIQYDYIEKHEHFASKFLKRVLANKEDTLIKFKGTRPELWYILYKIYKNKLHFMGMPLHKIAGDLFVFIGKQNTPNVMNANWQKFKSHIDEPLLDEQYIEKKLTKAHRLIVELKLPSNNSDSKQV